MMYAAHKAAGGMTSIYRQVGMGGQWVFNKVLQDTLGLTHEQANWTYTVPDTKGGTRNLSLDGRIVLEDVADPGARDRVRAWMEAGLRRVLVEHTAANAPKNGIVFEVRQGYKSKDSKRQNADLANAANAYVEGYLPSVVLLSNQIDGDLVTRYTQARWLMLTGTTAELPWIVPTSFVAKCWDTIWRDSLSGILLDLRLNLKPFLRCFWSLMPTETKVVPRFDHLTYRGNSRHSRYGWLRLTPAFSVHLIQENVRCLPTGAKVLDPFSGTGTTALVCAEEGVHERQLT